MEAWGGAMLRAVTGDASLQWSGQTLYRGTTPIPQAAAHHSQVPLLQTDQRGLLDSMGLRLQWSDQALFQAHLPQDPVERMVFELLAHGEARRLVGAVHIADAGEIASANDRVDLPPGMRERFRMEDGIREVVFGISTVADVAIRGRDHESGPIALGVEGRANAFRALAIHRGHQQIWQTREAVGINKGPAELPFHPRVGDGGIPEHSRHLRYRSHVGNVMIP
jgi:hypothetical protein